VSSTIIHCCSYRCNKWTGMSDPAHTNPLCFRCVNTHATPVLPKAKTCIRLAHPRSPHARRYTIFINIAVQGSSDQAWHIAQGPLSLVFGVLLGAAVALGCAATRVWNNRYKRIIVLFVSGAPASCCGRAFSMAMSAVGADS
jgi:hypothetical protein